MSTPDPRPPSLWASADVARNYATLRSDLSDAVRAVWVEAFRSAVPPAPRRRLLDVGCGTGRFTALLADVFASPTIGVDGSLAMLRECPMPTGTPVAYVGGHAAALPLPAASVDLVLLSMIYHLLAPAGPAVAELYRVVRPGGWVLIRTPTAELMDRVSFMPFFPEARAVDEARIPSRARVTATFEGAGFVTHAHRTIEQELAQSPTEALEKVRRRVYSTLRLISEDAFATGLARYEAHCLSAPPGPLIEPLDFFVFHRA